MHTSSDKDIIVTLPGRATMEMVSVEPGIFAMGSPSWEPGRNSDEGPQHEVRINEGFHLGKYEITQGQWESVMETRPWTGKKYALDNPDHPAVYISWNDLQEFIRRSNEGEGAEVYRLPTESEWEYACRAGMTTRWSFGDDEGRLGSYAWYRDNAWNTEEKHAHAVGLKLPNSWGLHDMHGNIWEWVQDGYGPYSGSRQVDPGGPASDSYRIVRGGGFVSRARHVRSSVRYRYSPDNRASNVGARLLRHAP